MSLISRSSAVELFRSGNFELAAQMFRQLTDETPDDVNLLISRATCEYKLSNFGAACHLLKQAIKKEPDNNRALFDYAWLRFRKRDYIEARHHFTAIPRHSNYYPRVLAPLAETLILLGDLAGAKKLLPELKAIDPSSGTFLYGKIAEREFDYQAAERAFEEAIRLGYGTEARSARAYALVALGAKEDAVELWRSCHRAKRTRFATQVKRAKKLWVRREKLQNDLYQSLLIDQTSDNLRIREYIELIESAFRTCNDDEGNIHLQGELLQRFSAFLNQPIHLFSETWTGGKALSSGVDWHSVNHALSTSPRRYVVVDDILSVECLKYLQRFCVESMVWYYDRDQNGYAGSYMEDGLCSEVLLCVADGLRVALGPTLNGVALSKVWAFKYSSNTSGISPHADLSKLTVNLWLCPDEGNLDQETGGLKMYDVSAPPGRGFYNYNSSPKWLQGFLNRSGAPESIPHRCNRAVIFDSSILHATDEAHFADDYSLRRINLTFSYGYR